LPVSPAETDLLALDEVAITATRPARGPSVALVVALAALAAVLLVLGLRR